MKRTLAWIFCLIMLPGLLMAEQTKPSAPEKPKPPKVAKEPKAEDKEDHEQTKADFKKIIDEYYAAWNTMNPQNADKYYSHDPDLVFYDIAPMKYAGWENYKNGVIKLLEPYATFKLIPSNDLKITRKGKIVWTTLTFHISGKAKDGKSGMELDCRHTAIWEKTKGNWLIVHEHVSAPLPAESK
jgi:ketosteroid isomerase-like protein